MVGSQTGRVDGSWLGGYGSSHHFYFGSNNAGPISLKRSCGYCFGYYYHRSYKKRKQTHTCPAVIRRSSPLNFTANVLNYKKLRTNVPPADFLAKLAKHYPQARESRTGLRSTWSIRCPTTVSGRPSASPAPLAPETDASTATSLAISSAAIATGTSPPTTVPARPPTPAGRQTPAPAPT